MTKDEPTIEEKIKELECAGWKRYKHRPGVSPGIDHYRILSGVWVSRSGALYYASPSRAWVLMKRSVEGVLSGLERAMDD